MEAGASDIEAPGTGAKPLPEPRAESEPETAPGTDPAPIATATAIEAAPARRGPGFVALVLGGAVAAALGYGAAVYGIGLGPAGPSEADTALAAAVEEQGAALAELGDRTAGIGDQIAALAAREVDLGPLEDRIAALAEEVAASAGVAAELADRVAALEARPLLTGEGDADQAAVAAAMAELQANLREQQAANAALAEDIRRIAEEAEARIAAAEDRAEARVGTATAQAALSQLRIALAAGTPFAGALRDVAANAGVEVPADLAAVAETGVPTLEDLQARFPAAARAALPVALRETAGEGTMDRVGAFLRGQVGGRSLEPRAGDDPDAVLSRAEGALRSGDLAAALEEIAALPEAAQAELAGWSELARRRLTATEAMAAFTATLGDTN